MKTICQSRLHVLSTMAILSLAAACSAAETPKPADVERALQQNFGQSPPGVQPKVTVTLNNVRFGSGYRATVQEVQVEGYPEKADVTPAVVDFTVRTYYASETQALRRARDARVYRDKMGDWAVMTGSVRGTDTTVTERP